MCTLNLQNIHDLPLCLEIWLTLLKASCTASGNVCRWLHYFCSIAHYILSNVRMIVEWWIWKEVVVSEVWGTRVTQPVSQQRFEPIPSSEYKSRNLSVWLQLVLGTCPVQMSAGASIILTHIRPSPDYLRANDGIDIRLVHSHLLSHPVQFVIH
jgi:hypothetical protein